MLFEVLGVLELEVAEVSRQADHMLPALCHLGQIRPPTLALCFVVAQEAAVLCLEVVEVEHYEVLVVEHYLAAVVEELHISAKVVEQRELEVVAVM